jgi:hypothetical protein
VLRRSDCEDILTALSARLAAGARVFLVGETSQLWEGWVEDAPLVHLAAEPAGRAALERAVASAEPSIRGRVLLESPGDVIPLPAGHEVRARPVLATADGAPPPLTLAHFDPYSVSFRLLARGDEEDYRVVLRYLRHGWVNVPGMDALLLELLPRFTNDTIQQDPAEFRRKYKGLKQMWTAEASSLRDQAMTGYDRR